MFAIVAVTFGAFPRDEMGLATASGLDVDVLNGEKFASVAPIYPLSLKRTNMNARSSAMKTSMEFQGMRVVADAKIFRRLRQFYEFFNVLGDICGGLAGFRLIIYLIKRDAVKGFVLITWRSERLTKIVQRISEKLSFVPLKAYSIAAIVLFILTYSPLPIPSDTGTSYILPPNNADFRIVARRRPPRDSAPHADGQSKNRHSKTLK